VPNFSIWLAGYPASPEAQNVGTEEGATFKDACIKWANRRQITHFNPKTLIWAGVSLHPTRAKALIKKGRK
jgi:hypothetical protein